jgi:hypothetical protein
MSARLVELLGSLRDVEGVIGAFLWSRGGAGVLARDLPAHIESDVLAEVGPRIERIFEAFEGAGDDLDLGSLVFGEHKLHLHELEPAFVAVLSASRVNLPALKMALHLVGRGVCAELDRLRTTPGGPAPASG